MLSDGIMIHYRYKKPRILFVGINPHFGSFNRGVPFSNNKMFWYLLSDSGILKETRADLRDDDALRRFYKEKFNDIYELGFVNIINRPTRDISALKKGEELPGRRRISRIIKTEKPPVVCFIGKISYEKYIGSKDFSFGWQEPINQSRIFVMHFPLRGEAIVRTGELKDVLQATLDQKHA